MVRLVDLTNDMLPITFPALHDDFDVTAHDSKSSFIFALFLGPNRHGILGPEHTGFPHLGFFPDFLSQLLHMPDTKVSHEKPHET